MVIQVEEAHYMGTKVVPLTAGSSDRHAGEVSHLLALRIAYYVHLEATLYGWDLAALESTEVSWTGLNWYAVVV